MCHSGPMTRFAPSASTETSSSPSLLVTALTEAGATAEFTLARLWRPQVDESRWLEFLEAWRSDPSSRGILSARNQRGGVLGFVPWWRQPDLEHGESLLAGPFVVRELGVRPLVRDSLMQALDELSGQLGIQLRLIDGL